MSPAAEVPGPLLGGAPLCPLYLSLLKSPSGLSIRGSKQPIPRVSTTTEGGDATIATHAQVR